MKSRVAIITGITGQDGSYMADHLLENTDVKVVGVMRRSATNSLINISHLEQGERFELVTGDLSDSQSIDNLVKDAHPDYFINFAAQSFVGASWQIPEQTFEVNAVGVIRCLEAIRKHAPLCRMYNAGSSEEFGNVDYSPQDEDHPLKPRSPYGASKAAARHIIKVYRESYGLYAIQGILYNHESRKRGEEFVTRKISKGVARIKNELNNGAEIQPIELGNINSQRDWSHAKDLVRGIWSMLNLERPQEYVLASGETHTIREFVELAFAHAGIKGNWSFAGTIGNYVPPENEVFRADTGQILMRINPKFYRPAEVDLLLGDPSLARQDLGWTPEISFDMLVKEMVDSDIKNT